MTTHDSIVVYTDNGEEEKEELRPFIHVAQAGRWDAQRWLLITPTEKKYLRTVVFGRSIVVASAIADIVQRVHVDKCHPYLLWLFHLLSENRYTAVGTVLDSAFQEGIDVYTDVINVVTVWQPRGSESDILSNVLRIHKLNAQQNPVVAFLRSIFPSNELWNIPATIVGDYIREPPT